MEKITNKHELRERERERSPVVPVVVLAEAPAQVVSTLPDYFPTAERKPNEYKCLSVVQSQGPSIFNSGKYKIRSYRTKCLSRQECFQIHKILLVMVKRKQ